MTTHLSQPLHTGNATLRSVDEIIRPPARHWVGDGFYVRGYFSGIPDAVRRLSPFLLLDYHPPHDYSPSARPRGVGVHPHRGFETVTMAFAGSVSHHDSAGGGGTIGPGEAQWMTAASGVLHKEYHEANFARRGGTFHMAQLWVNLPRTHKMTSPRYQAITAPQYGVATLPDGAGTVRILAGAYQGVEGPAKTFSPVHIYEVHLTKDGQVLLPFPAQYNVSILVMSGALQIQGRPVAQDELVLFQHDGANIQLLATEATHLLVLAGEPIDEPVVQYGPFVMNTQAEIQQAIHDFNRGAFGSLDP